MLINNLCKLDTKLNGYFQQTTTMRIILKQKQNIYTVYVY